MMGMSSLEWSRYMAEALGVPGTPEEINADVVARMLARYGEAPPLIPGAVEAVRRIAARWPLAIASSSNPELIEVVVARPGSATSSRSRCRRRRCRAGSRRPTSTSRPRGGSGSRPSRCGAVEDSHNGIRSAEAAGMRVVAVPNPHFPPDDEAIALADVVLASIAELQVEHFAVCGTIAPSIARSRRLEAVVDRLEVDDDDRRAVELRDVGGRHHDRSPSLKRAPPALTIVTRGSCCSSASCTSSHRTVSPAM